MRRSLVCGALWYVALYGGHLTGPDHYVAKLQISFFSGTGGTAVSLASGSRFVTPTLDRTRPRSRHIQYTHARYVAYTRYYKNGRGHSARISIEHCVWALTLHCVHRLVYSCWASWVLMSDGPWPGESQSVRVLWGSALAGPDATLPPPCVLKLNLEASNCHPKYACVYAGALGAGNHDTCITPSPRSHSPFLGCERSQSKKMAALRLLVAVGAVATAHGALELDMDNWDGALAGKSAFVKFLAPW